MSRIIRPLIAFILGISLLALAPPAQAKATGRPVAVQTLYYDAGPAAEFRATVDEAAQVWNSSVTGVRLVPGTPADFVVYADDGWPRALPTGLGRGMIWMGRQAVSDGHNPLRIAAHEIGHILGLPDWRTGRCEDLMSGASAGTSCANPNPNPAERAAVERNFSGAAPGVGFGRILVDGAEPAAR